MNLKTETHYRVRWSRPGWNPKTRIYTRPMWARKKAAAYQAEGYDVQLDSRIVQALTDWAPLGPEEVTEPREPIKRYQCTVQAVVPRFGNAAEVLVTYSVEGVDVAAERTVPVARAPKVGDTNWLPLTFHEDEAGPYAKVGQS
jgi:hypothetical protein